MARKISSCKEVNQLVRDARERGWSVDNSGPHLKLRLAGKLVVVGRTPSDTYRALKNATALMRRIETQQEVAQ